MISSVGIVVRDPVLGGAEHAAARLGRAWSNVGVDVTFYQGLPEGLLRMLVRVEPQMALADSLAARPVHAILIPGVAYWPFARQLSRLPDERRPVIVAQVGAGLCTHRRPPVKRLFHDLRMRRFLREIDGLVVPSDVAAARAGRILGRGPVVRTIATPLSDDDVRPSPGGDALGPHGEAAHVAEPVSDHGASHRFGDVALAYLDFFGTLRSRRCR